MLPTEAPAPIIRPDGAGFVLTTSQYVNRPLQDAFAFFADAANLEKITPAYLGFDIRTPLPITMRDGALIEYRIRLGGIPMTWLTRIDRWRPGVEFVDTQLAGPYAKWVHLHSFRAEGSGTRMEDRVEYRLPLAPLSLPAHALFVRPMLERIFRHRWAVIAEKLG